MATLDQLKTQSSGLLDQAFAIGAASVGGSPPPVPPLGISLTGGTLFVRSNALKTTASLNPDTFVPGNVLAQSTLAPAQSVSKSFPAAQITKVVFHFDDSVKSIIFANGTNIPHEGRMA